MLDRGLRRKHERHRCSTQGRAACSEGRGGVGVRMLGKGVGLCAQSDQEQGGMRGYWSIPVPG